MPFMNISRSSILSVFAPSSRFLMGSASVKLRLMASKSRSQCVSLALLPVGGHEFEVVSDTHQLDAIMGHLAFQVFPIVAAFCVVFLIVDGAHDIRGREPPFGVFLIPNCTNHVVIVESYRFLVHNTIIIRWQRYIEYLNLSREWLLLFTAYQG